MMAGGVGIFLSGCQHMFWWRQKPEADRPSSPRQKPAQALPAGGPAATEKPLPTVQRQETALGTAPVDKSQPPEALTVPKKFTYPVALAVPGREGFVLSPFNQKMVDVAGFKSGALVADPHYPLSEKKFFRVP